MAASFYSLWPLPWMHLVAILGGKTISLRWRYVSIPGHLFQYLRISGKALCRGLCWWSSLGGLHRGRCWLWEPARGPWLMVAFIVSVALEVMMTSIIDVCIVHIVCLYVFFCSRSTKSALHRVWWPHFVFSELKLVDLKHVWPGSVRKLVSMGCGRSLYIIYAVKVAIKKHNNK